MTTRADDYHIGDLTPATHERMKIMEHAIRKAKEAGANRVILYTNSKLALALSLYKKLGFLQIDRGESKYPSADMEFELII